MDAAPLRTASASPHSPGNLIRNMSSDSIVHDLSDVRSQVALLQTRLQKANETARRLHDENSYFRERYGLIKQDLIAVQRNTITMQQQLTASSLALEDTQTKLSQSEVLNIMLEDKLHKAIGSFEELSNEYTRARAIMDGCQRCTAIASGVPVPVPEEEEAEAAVAAAAAAAAAAEAELDAQRAKAIVERFSVNVGTTASLPRRATLMAGIIAAEAEADAVAQQQYQLAQQQQQQQQQAMGSPRSPASRSLSLAPSSPTAATRGVPSEAGAAESIAAAAAAAADSDVPPPSPMSPATGDRLTVATFASSGKDSAYYSRAYSMASSTDRPNTMASDVPATPTTPVDGGAAGLGSRSTVDFMAMSMEEQFAALQSELSGFTPEKHIKGPQLPTVSAAGAAAMGVPHQPMQSSSASLAAGATVPTAPPRAIDTRRMREETQRQSFDLLKALSSLERQLDQVASVDHPHHAARVLAAPGRTGSPGAPSPRSGRPLARGSSGLAMRSASVGAPDPRDSTYSYASSSGYSGDWDGASAVSYSSAAQLNRSGSVSSHASGGYMPPPVPPMPSITSPTSTSFLGFARSAKGVDAVSIASRESEKSGEESDGKKKKKLKKPPVLAASGFGLGMGMGSM
ncbi:hypothetical protein BC828DRAFT_251396 [Blastocladiella britannica]|nr:hypothetical protein BC828DRAFT_251396 [Blastocladiella britannica]